MDLAAERLPPDGLIATTDADSEPAPDWLRAQLDAVAARRARDRRADRARRARPPARRAARREADAAKRHAGARPARARASTTSSAAPRWRSRPRPTRRSAGWSRATALEDEGFERALHRHGVPIERLAAVRVTTSGRRFGRARRGLAVDLRRNGWLAERSYDAGDFTLERLLRAKDRSVSVILPTREVAATLAGACSTRSSRCTDLIDELLVVDADSRDGTADDRPRARRATSIASPRCSPPSAPRSARATRCGAASRPPPASSSCFLDTDTEDFDARFALGLLGPLLTDPASPSSRATSAARSSVGDTTTPDGGGRVTELLARPYLNLHFPELAGFRQPLAGELAATRELLERLPFPVGYGVEIAMLIDVAPRRRPRADGAGRPRHAPEPPPAAARALADGARGAGRGRAAHARDRRRPRPAADPDGARLRGPRRAHRRAPAELSRA